MNLRQFALNLPIKRKLLLGLVGTCMVALLLAGTALFWFQSVSFKQAFAAELETLGAIIAQNSAAPLAFEDRKSAIEVLNSLRAKAQMTGASVYDRRGEHFASMASGPAVLEESEAQDRSGVIFQDGYASLSLPIRWEDSRAGHLTLRARFADEYRELLTFYAIVLGGVVLGTLLVIVLMSSFLQRLITYPIVALADVARNISEKKDYSARAVEYGNDEVGRLTRTFNRMLEQIQSRDHRLRESQERYEVAVMGSTDGLWDYDLAQKKVYLSPRWKAMLGYADDELPTSLTTFGTVLHEDDRERVLAGAVDYLEGRRPAYEMEFRARHQDGESRWILSRGAALWDEQGKAVRFAGSHTDITQRKRAEEDIRLARAKFESLVNSIAGIVWEADPDTFEMLFVSSQAEGMLGYPVSRWLEDPRFWLSLVHPDDRAATEAGRTQRLSHGQAYQLEFRVVGQEGRTVWIRETASMVQEADHPPRLRGLALDITEQKRGAEQITRMQRELVDASRAAGMAEIATGVLHNVGNVLNSVNISTGLILEQISRSKTASLGKAVKLLQEHQGDIAAFLLGDPRGKQLPGYLSAISKELIVEQALLAKEAHCLQQGVEHIKQIVAMQQAYAKVSGALETLALVDVVEDALRMAMAALARNGIEVVRQFEPVPLVLVDRHKVLQILINLIGNAVQALDARLEGRQITLKVTRGHRAGEGVRVEVRDNGHGITPENLTRIFNHGFTTKKTGHGFGLHSGSNTAKEMGGSLDVESAGAGHGACFALELPLRKSAAPGSASPTAQDETLLRQAAA